MWNNEPPATMPTGSQAKTGCLFFILAKVLTFGLKRGIL
jgi:hypothetical protein